MCCLRQIRKNLHTYSRAHTHTFPLGPGHTPFYVARGQRPRRPLAPSAAAQPAPDPPGPGKDAARPVKRRSCRCGSGRTGASLRRSRDASRRDVRFSRTSPSVAVEDEAPLDTEPSESPVPSVPAAFLQEFNAQSPAVFSFEFPAPGGPRAFRVLARTAPKRHRLDSDIPATWRVPPEFDAECLRRSRPLTPLSRSRPRRRRRGCGPPRACGRSQRARGACAAAAVLPAHLGGGRHVGAARLPRYHCKPSPPARLRQIRRHGTRRMRPRPPGRATCRWARLGASLAGRSMGREFKQKRGVHHMVRALWRR